eukprot:CAMPEP_0180324736 /NCGR_PEP_ID=MMETSP0988-20121125/38018_1 /TAXON_ID=697907 /ORGANISM="non described non described, Strain CCMP2293" /LENGTH=104 /DNA_ID=CAMNT_0022311055 /DNA_START=1 /DNA_END=311 /DNA_ORIENTATION=+
MFAMKHPLQGKPQVQKTGTIYLPFCAQPARVLITVLRFLHKNVDLIVLRPPKSQEIPTSKLQKRELSNSFAKSKIAKKGFDHQLSAKKGFDHQISKGKGEAAKG